MGRLGFAFWVMTYPLRLLSSSSCREGAAGHAAQHTSPKLLTAVMPMETGSLPVGSLLDVIGCVFAHCTAPVVLLIVMAAGGLPESIQNTGSCPMASTGCRLRGTRRCCHSAAHAEEEGHFSARWSNHDRSHWKHPAYHCVYMANERT